MQINALLSSFIYLIATSLLFPVLLLLSLLTLWIMVQAGSFFGEWLERSRLKPASADDLLHLIKEEKTPTGHSHHVLRFASKLRGTAEAPPDLTEPLIERSLQEISLSLVKSLDGVRMMIRVGPSLGLMGTLIPMGTGLAALAQGDITKLSTDLVIAFTTTVVGLAQGVCAYVFFTIRKRWIEKDIGIMEFLAEMATTQRREEQGDAFHEKRRKASAL